MFFVNFASVTIVLLRIPVECPTSLADGVDVALAVLPHDRPLGGSDAFVAAARFKIVLAPIPSDFGITAADDALLCLLHLKLLLIN